jgi:hypothetical protein
MLIEILAFADPLLKLWYLRYITTLYLISHIPQLWYIRKRPKKVVVYEKYGHFFMAYKIFSVRIM